MHNPEAVLENETKQTRLGFCDTNVSPNHGLTTRPSYNQQEKKKNLPNCVDFAVPAKYQDLIRELKKLLNMKVTVIPVIIGALGTVNKGLIQGQENLEI